MSSNWNLWEDAELGGAILRARAQRSTGAYNPNLSSNWHVRRDTKQWTPASAIRPLTVEEKMELDVARQNPRKAFLDLEATVAPKKKKLVRVAAVVSSPPPQIPNVPIPIPIPVPPKPQTPRMSVTDTKVNTAAAVVAAMPKAGLTAIAQLVNSRKRGTTPKQAMKIFTKKQHKIIKKCGGHTKTSKKNLFQRFRAAYLSGKSGRGLSRKIERCADTIVHGKHSKNEKTLNKIAVIAHRGVKKEETKVRRAASRARKPRPRKTPQYAMTYRQFMAQHRAAVVAEVAADGDLVGPKQTPNPKTVLIKLAKRWQDYKLSPESKGSGGGLSTGGGIYGSGAYGGGVTEDQADFNEMQQSQLAGYRQQKAEAEKAHADRQACADRQADWLGRRRFNIDDYPDDTFTC